MKYISSYKDRQPLKSGQIHLWLVKLSELTLKEEDKGSLDAGEISRGERLIFKHHRENFFKSHVFLRQVLSSYLDREDSEIVYSYHENGKPYLADNSLSFNLSHSGDYALLGICLDKAIGVDIEHHKYRDFLGIAKHSFSSAEVDLLKEQEEQALMQRFYEIWSKKEAYIKYTGQGLKEALDGFYVTLDENPAFIIKNKVKQPLILRYFIFNQLYSVAVCTEQGLADLTVVNVNEFPTKIN